MFDLIVRIKIVILADHFYAIIFLGMQLKE